MHLVSIVNAYKVHVYNNVLFVRVYGTIKHLYRRTILHIYHLVHLYVSMLYSLRGVINSFIIAVNISSENDNEGPPFRERLRKNFMLDPMC